MNKYIAEKKMVYEIYISMMEIYNEVIIDLLTNPPTSGLKIREFPKVGMKVIGVQETPCCTPEDVFNAIAAGTANKHTGSHAMNTRSSRSHTVFQVTVNGRMPTGSTIKAKINMVDLAGSERIKKTGAVGQSLEEAKKINLSLSTLGNCINAVVENRSSIPFRESKLTLILKDSLGGNSLTSLCVMTSKRMVHGDETLSTL
jgi:kinesin family protein 5